MQKKLIIGYDETKKMLNTLRKLNGLIVENELGSEQPNAQQADANQVDYKGDQILVINTSTNDIEGRDWLNNIPRGSIVVLQGRDHQELSNGIETIDSFDRAYPLSETLYLGSIVVEDHEGYNYLRFMKIGVA